MNPILGVVGLTQIVIYVSFVSLTEMSSTLKAMLSNKTIEPNDGRSPCIEVTDIKYETFMVRVMIELTFSFMNASCFIRESITHFLSLSFEGWKTLSVYTGRVSIQWIAQCALVTLMRQIQTHPVDTIIHSQKNRARISVLEYGLRVLGSSLKVLHSFPCCSRTLTHHPFPTSQSER